MGDVEDAGGRSAMEVFLDDAGGVLDGEGVAWIGGGLPANWTILALCWRWRCWRGVVLELEKSVLMRVCMGYK